MNNLPPSAIIKRLQRLQFVLLAAFLIIFAALFYWSSIRGADILTREDNPRLVEAELRIDRGQILDRHGTIIAQSLPDENGRYQRQYPFATIGAGVGYYNFRHGTAGAEDAFNAVLRGEPVSANPEWRQTMLNEPQRGFDIQLTLDASLQTAASDLMEGHKGALLLLNIPSGEILALVNKPDYDPNNLETSFAALNENPEAPLLNRALQGDYQPGLALQPFLIALALDQKILALSEVAPNANLPVQVNGHSEQCLTPSPETADWAAVLQNRCPYPMLILADRLGSSGINRFYQRFGFNMRPALLAESEVRDVQTIGRTSLAAIGQDRLTATPLQVARAWGALLNEGILPAPRLVTAVQDSSGEWQQPPRPASDASAVSAAAARSTLELLRQGDQLLYTVPVLSGPAGGTNSWVLGAFPAVAPEYLIVIILEDEADWQAAAELGTAVLELLNR